MMKNIRYAFITVLSLMLSTICSAQDELGQVIINELVPNNVNTVYDEDYRFPEGWVELYNTTDQDIDIMGWYLTKKKSEPTMWRIPDHCVIPSHGYVVIYLDETEEELEQSGFFHADFSLENISGMLYLVRDDGSIEDFIERYENAPINHSYGRCVSDPTLWVWFEQSTPMKPNGSDCEVREVAPDVSFDVQGGLFYQPIKLTLQAPYPFENNIRYTLDGTEPTIKSALYIHPIDIDSSTVVKAKVIKGISVLTKPANVNTYILMDRKIDIPVMALTFEPDYLWDDTLGIYVVGKTGVYDDAIGGPCNYRTNRRRPLNLEYYVDNKQVLNQLCEARIAGGFTRGEPIKSLKIYAKRRYGEKYFPYKFFAEKDSKEKEGYRSIFLRNGGNDAQLTILKDAFLQKFAGGKVNLDYQACQSVVVFMNGQYWGIENIREMDNDDYILSNYGIEAVDVFKNYELKDGTYDAYNELCEFLSQPNFSHEKLCSLVDVDEFLNYMSLQAFVGNYDWPNNNHVFWRDRNNGKWRWIVKDLDGGFGYWPSSTNADIRGVNLNPFNFLSRTDPYFSFGNNEWATRLLEQILSDPIVQRQYIERIAIQLGDIFHKSELYHVIDSMTSIIANEIPYHKDRWGQPQTVWDACIQQMPEWIEYRHDILYGMLSQYYSLGKEIPLTISSLLDGDVKYGNLFLGGEKLYRDRFDGKWFQNDSILVEATPYVFDKVFLKWVVLSTDEMGDTLRREFFDHKLAVKINEETSFSLSAVYTTDQVGVFSAEDVKPSLTYYPNPVEDELHVQVRSSNVSSVEILDVAGRSIRKMNVGGNSFVINMSSLQSGVYLLVVRFSDSNGQSVYKVTKL